MCYVGRMTENVIQKRKRTMKADALTSFPLSKEWFENFVRGMLTGVWRLETCGFSGEHVRESGEHARE